MSKEILAGAYSGGGLRFKKNPQKIPGYALGFWGMSRKLNYMEVNFV